MNKDSCLLKCNVAWEEPRLATAIDDYCATQDFVQAKFNLAANWQTIAAVENPIILSDGFLDNYFHFSLECVPRMRFFAAYGSAPSVIPKDGTGRNYQADLLGKVHTGRVVLPITGAVRVRNPLLGHATLSEEGVLWLRDATGIRAYPGERRIYIRRSGRGTRTVAGGGISESEGFLRLIRELGFETVEFGDGDLTVEAQVRLLDGARVIVAAHGAALTNLAYLNPPLSVIETIGTNTLRAVFMHLSSMLGFHHQALVSSVYDASGNIFVDIEDLRQAVEAALH